MIYFCTCIESHVEILDVSTEYPLYQPRECFHVLCDTARRHSSEKQRLTRSDIENGLHKNSVYLDTI